MNNSESIILSKKSLGESDLLVSFFSKAEGKIKGVAKFAKKSKKRFGGMLQEGYVVDMEYAVQPGSELCRINQVSLVAPTFHAEAKLGATYSLWLALELAERFLAAHETNEEKYVLLKRFVIAVHEGRITRGVVIYFMNRWITLSGYAPEFSNCMVCGREDDVLLNFSMIQGGLVCKNCNSGNNLLYQFRNESVDAIKKIIDGDIGFFVNNPVFEDVLRFMFMYCMVLLGRPLKIENYISMLMEIYT